MVHHLLALFSVLAVISHAASLDCTNPEHLRTAGKIALAGSALGGELYLGSTWSQNPAVVKLSTALGESAASVASRLAALIDEAWGADWRAGACCVDNTVYLSNSMYFLAGTEAGLGIPRAPRSLTTKYDADQNRLVLTWDNCGETYDLMTVSFNWGWGELYRVHFAGSRESFEVDLSSVVIGLEDLSVWVVGYRGLTPSGPSIARLTHDGKSQEELYGAPHIANLPPNWTSWSRQSGELIYQQMVRDESVAHDKSTPILVTAPKQKPYWLRILTTTARSQGGIWRKYIGLNAGHKYRVHARVRCGELPPNDNGDWAVSFHAALTDSNRRDFSTEQFLGRAPLPDGKVGPDAGRFAFFVPGKDTEGEFQMCTTGDSGSGDEISDITIPEGRDTIIVWLRVTGTVPPAGVGFDWIRLEDLTP